MSKLLVEGRSMGRGRATFEWIEDGAFLPEFHQRFAGAFRDADPTIECWWESSPDGIAWELDFAITYRKTS